MESLIVDMDLDVVAQSRGDVVKSRFDFAELRAQVLRQTSLVERASQVGHLRRRHEALVVPIRATVSGASPMKQGKAEVTATVFQSTSVPPFQTLTATAGPQEVMLKK